MDIKNVAKKGLWLSGALVVGGAAGLCLTSSVGLDEKMINKNKISISNHYREALKPMNGDSTIYKAKGYDVYLSNDSVFKQSFETVVYVDSFLIRDEITKEQQGEPVFVGLVSP